MSYELTPLEAAKASVVKAEQDTQALELVTLLVQQQTAQIARDTEQAKAMTAALALAQQQPGKGSSDRAWLVLAALGGGCVLVVLFLAVAVAAVAVGVSALVALKLVRELRKDSK
jgi:biotin-(acetyl-CoA carboxylase) ligase